MAGVDAVIARGFVDERRMGVTGGSGGGLLTNWVITHTDRFAAAITQRCVSDWASMYYSCDFTLFTPAWFRKPRSRIRASTRTVAGRLRVGGEDAAHDHPQRGGLAHPDRTGRDHVPRAAPAAEAGGDGAVPGESHELSRSGIPSRRVQNQRHIRRWFDKHLLGAPIPDYDA